MSKCLSQSVGRSGGCIQFSHYILQTLINSPVSQNSPKTENSKSKNPKTQKLNVKFNELKKLKIEKISYKSTNKDSGLKNRVSDRQTDRQTK